MQNLDFVQEKYVLFIANQSAIYLGFIDRQICVEYWTNFLGRETLKYVSLLCMTCIKEDDSY